MLTPTKTETSNRPKCPVLFSYAFLRLMKESQIDYIFNNPRIEILVDCGAFTALNAGQEIKLVDYMNFLKTYKDRVFGYIALDKLGDPKQTDINLQIMLDADLHPIPVHVRGDKQERMDYLFSLSDWVACGGFKRPHRGPADKTYIKQKMIWAKGRNVHWLGYTTLSMLKGFKPYSCDTSSWSAPIRYGRLDIYTGNGEWIDYNYKEVLMCKTIPNSVLQVLDRNGFTLRDFKNKFYWDCSQKDKTPERTMLGAVSIDSWLRYVKDLRKNLGTRLFLACLPDHWTVELLYKRVGDLFK